MDFLDKIRTKTASKKMHKDRGLENEETKSHANDEEDGTGSKKPDALPGRLMGPEGDLKVVKDGDFHKKPDKTDPEKFHKLTFNASEYHTISEFNLNAPEGSVISLNGINYIKTPNGVAVVSGETYGAFVNQESGNDKDFYDYDPSILRAIQIQPAGTAVWVKDKFVGISKGNGLVGTADLGMLQANQGYIIHHEQDRFRILNETYRENSSTLKEIFQGLSKEGSMVGKVFILDGVTFRVTGNTRVNYIDISGYLK